MGRSGNLQSVRLTSADSQNGEITSDFPTADGLSSGEPASVMSLPTHRHSACKSCGLCRTHTCVRAAKSRMRTDLSDPI